MLIPRRRDRLGAEELRYLLRHYGDRLPPAQHLRSVALLQDARTPVPAGVWGWLVGVWRGWQLQRLAQQILAVGGAGIIWSRCPRCAKLLRTPRARQCPRCFLAWHRDPPRQW